MTEVTHRSLEIFGGDPSVKASSPAEHSSTGNGPTEKGPSWQQRLSAWEAALSDRLSPIVVKEVRQSLKSRQFFYTYVAMLLAVWGWSIFGVVMLLPAAYYLPAGKPLLVGYLMILSVPAVLIIPLAVHRSLAGESDEDTFELLSITALSAKQIILGKLASGMLQFVLLASILAPCFAFAFALRGLELSTVIGVFALVALASGFMTALGLFLAAIVRGRMGQLLVLVAQIGASVLMLWLLLPMGTMWIAGEFSGIFQAFEFLIIAPVIIGFTLFVLLSIRLLLRIAAARLSPISENRSTAIRYGLFQTQIAFIFLWTFIAELSSWRNYILVLEVGIMETAILWAVFGAFMIGESPQISPRVRRDLPRSVFGRMLLGWTQPGPMTGLVFATIGLLTGICALVGAGFWINSMNMKELVQVGSLCFGYVATLLTLVMILTHFMRSRVREGWVISTSFMVIIAFLAAFLPYSLGSLFNQGRVLPYGWSQITNWVYTFHELNEGSLDPLVPLAIGILGLLAVCGYLPFAAMQLHLPTLALPDRMLEEDAAERQAAESFDPLA